MPRRRARFDQDEEGKVYRMHLSRWDRFLSIASLAFSFSFKEIGRLVDPFEDGRSRLGFNKTPSFDESSPTV